MKKIQLVQAIAEEGVIAVLRGDSPEQVQEMAEHAIAGGIKVIEITMTIPFALRAIEALSRKYRWDSPDPDTRAIIGAGTVLDSETARSAILSGAAFVVGPALDRETVMLCNLYRIPVMPGAVTIRDIQEALRLGVDIIKLFPGNLFEPGIISAIKGPLPQANLMPTGGVTLENLGDWIKAGAVAVGIGSDLTREAVAGNDLSLIRSKAAAYREAYIQAKTRLPRA